MTDKLAARARDIDSACWIEDGKLMVSIAGLTEAEIHKVAAALHPLVQKTLDGVLGDYVVVQDTGPNKIGSSH